MLTIFYAGRTAFHMLSAAEAIKSGGSIYKKLYLKLLVRWRKS